MNSYTCTKCAIFLTVIVSIWKSMLSGQSFIEKTNLSDKLILFYNRKAADLLGLPDQWLCSFFILLLYSQILQAKAHIFP